MKKIAVFVSGGGTNLQALLDAQARGELGGGEISVVISSNPDAYALERAKKAGVPTAVCSRKELGSQRAFEDALQKALEPYQVQLIVLAGFMSILSGEFIGRWPNRIINVHPALIPSFCGPGYYGLHVHKKALAYGVKLSGATVHFVSEECDGGPIILQKAVEVLPDDTPEILQRRIMEQCEWVLLPRAASLFCQDKIQVEGRRVRILD